jgi:hypothetical protein
MTLGTQVCKLPTAYHQQHIDWVDSHSDCEAAMALRLRLLLHHAPSPVLALPPARCSPPSLLVASLVFFVILSKREAAPIMAMVRVASPTEGVKFASHRIPSCIFLFGMLIHCHSYLQ